MTSNNEYDVVLVFFMFLIGHCAMIVHMSVLSVQCSHSSVYQGVVTPVHARLRVKMCFTEDEIRYQEGEQGQGQHSFLGNWCGNITTVLGHN